MTLNYWERILKLSLVVGLTTVLISAPLFSETMSQTISVLVDESPAGSYQVKASFIIPASRTTVWQVLTDYDAIDQFVPSILSSDLIERSDRKILVKQSGRVHWLLFKQDMALVLSIKEQATWQIDFEDLSKESFLNYSGSWTLEDRSQGTLVSYKVLSTPNFFVPPLVSKGLFSDQVREMLEQVRQRSLEVGALAQVAKTIQ